MKVSKAGRRRVGVGGDVEVDVGSANDLTVSGIYNPGVDDPQRQIQTTADTT
jgi:hypothetical protein